MILFVGLGNPGARYARNRHNIGFIAADEIMRAHGFPATRSRFHAEIAEGRIGTERAIVMKPTTFMNESGRAVAAAAQFYKIAPGEIIVFHDELDLPPGKLRVKTGGGTAGHNGLRSLGRHIGPDFRRVRLGIGHPGHRDLVHGYVLKDFPKADGEWIEPMINAIGEYAGLLASGDDGTFMNRVHLALNPDTGDAASDDAPGGGSRTSTGE